MRESWDEYFMRLAMDTRTRSTCLRRQVGAIIVTPRNHIVSTGYNGSLPGEPHCIDVGCDMVDGGCKRTIHAEDNALSRSTRRQRAGATLYCTDFPCLDCAKSIARKGIAEVVWMIPYRIGEKEVLNLFSYHGIVIREFVPMIFHEDFELTLK